MTKKKVRDQIPNNEKQWTERNLSEKIQVVIEYRMRTIILYSVPFLIFYLIMAIITQKWILFAVQISFYFIFLSALKSVVNPGKEFNPQPHLFCAIGIAIGTIILSTQYFI